MIRRLVYWIFTVPELPEVETVARTLYPHIAGQLVTGVNLLRESSLHKLSLPLATMLGSRFLGTGRRGKLLLFELDGEHEGEKMQLVAHLRMTGRLFTQSANAALGSHTRCIFGLKAQDGAESQLFFDDTRAFGQLFLATNRLLNQWDFWRNLGPEPLEMGDSELAGRLRGKKPLKTALMDQKVIAGIGNIYADEALFQAGISPLREAGSLTDAEVTKLHGAIQSILRLSISQCGSSIRDYRDADGNAGAFQNTFRVYGRGGQKCVNCGAALSKIKLASRSTVYCANCQR